MCGFNQESLLIFNEHESHNQTSAEDGENCTVHKSQKPKGLHSKHINCIYCGYEFHIQCERRAISERYI